MYIEHLSKDKLETVKKNIKKILFINSFFVFSQTMFLPLYAIYIQRIDQAVFHVGGIWSCYILAYGLITFFARKYLNNTEYSSNFMILNFCIKIIGWIGYIYVSELWSLYAIQILFAIGEAIGTPSYDLLYSINLTEGDYATDWGLDKSVNAFITAAGAFIGGFIVHYFGFIILLIIMIFLSTWSIILGLKLKNSLVRVNITKSTF